MPSALKAATSANPVEPQLTHVNLRQLCLRVPTLSPYRAKTLAIAGRIRTRVLPGSAPLYCLEDAQAIAVEMMVANREKVRA